MEVPQRGRSVCGMDHLHTYANTRGRHGRDPARRHGLGRARRASLLAQLLSGARCSMERECAHGQSRCAGTPYGVRLAEVGFLLILFAGIWLAAAQVPRFRLGTARMIVAGIALALGGLLLIIATHWGRFG